MKVEKDLQYTKSHEWVQFLDGGNARVGLTDFAQNELGDIVFINLGDEGDEFAIGDEIGDVESTKAVSEVYSPIAGAVAKVNEDILDSPEQINENPYGSWLIEYTDVSDKGDLISAAEYEELLKEG